MLGFFSKKETQTESGIGGKTLSCFSCGLYKDVISPKMQPQGKFKQGILNIGDFPSKQDDIKGSFFQGLAGDLLERTYAKMGVDLWEDCLNINALLCHPLSKNEHKTRLPSAFELDCCRINVMNIINQYKPKVIVLLGEYAVRSVIGNRWKRDLGGINKWRGWQIPDQILGTWICPTFNPLFVLDNKNEAVQTVWEQDVKKALKKAHKPFPTYEEPIVHIIDDLKVLSEIPPRSFVTFDYETTGLKPYADGHKIICASVGINEKEAYAFMMPEDKKQLKYFTDFLKNKNIKKGAHNLKFEEMWSYHCLGTRVKSWDWDGMLSAHIMDNRSGVTGLKFQTYVNFGQIDYSSEVDQWLRAADGKDANSKNTVEELIKTPKGRNTLLTYCGQDSVFEYRLALKQKEQYV